MLETGTAEQVEAYSPAVDAWVEARLYPAPEGLSVVFQDVGARRRRQEATAFLAQASRQLTASLEYQQTIRAVADAAVPMLGDWCVVNLIEDPEAHEWPPRLEPTMPVPGGRLRGWSSRGGCTPVRGAVSTDMVRSSLGAGGPGQP